MDGLIRDKRAVLMSLVVTDEGQVLTTKPTKIHVPKRFQDIGLLNIGSTVEAYGIFPIIVGNIYSVMVALTMVPLNPDRITRQFVGESDYYVFHFPKDTVMIPTLACVRKDNLPIIQTQEFIFKGKIPWYLEYDDLLKSYDTAWYYANSNIAASDQVMELLAAMVSRRQGALTEYYRTVREPEKERPVFIGMENVTYGATSTFGKFAGSYFAEGINSALTTETKEGGQIERILRQ